MSDGSKLVGADSDAMPRSPTRRTAISWLLGAPLAASAAAALRLNASAQEMDELAQLGLEPNSKLLMIGDSITDTGRARPVGEGRGDALGNGYVLMLDAILGAVHPGLGIRVVNMGVSGNTVRDLEARWQRDVFDLEPDYVSVMIGANDVWRQFDSPLHTETHVRIEEYERTYDELVAGTLPRVKGMILITPFYLEPNREDAMRAMMDDYGTAVRNVARRHGTSIIDSQRAFDALLDVVYPAVISWDRVHLNHVGAMVLARAIAQALEVRW